MYIRVLTKKSNYMGIFILLFVLLGIRFFEVYRFYQRVSKICNAYDWKYIDEHGDPLLDVLEDRDNYYIKAEWSAYNFLFLKGPNIVKIFFSLKPLRIEKQYSEEAVEKLKKYELIN